jgi:Zn-dependent protease with chaperone function
VSDPITAARELLPTGLTWVPVVVYPLLSVTLTVVCAALAIWLSGWSFRRRRPEHWVERARLAWAPRRTAVAWAWVAPIAAALLALRLDGGLTPLPAGGIAVLCFGLGWLAVLPLRAWVERRYGPAPVSAPVLVRSALTLGVVLYPHLLVWLALSVLMPPSWGPITWLLAVVALVVGALAFAGGGLRLGRLFGLVRPAPERLALLVRRAAEQVGLQPRAAWLLEVRSANAFAFSWSGDVGVTRGGLDALDDRGLFAVLAHELGHLSESRRVRVLRAAGTFAMVPLLLIRPLTASFGLGAPLIALGLVVLTSIVLRRLRRAMEVRADEVAHTHEEDPGTYARALETIYRVNGVPPVLHKSTTHPSLYDRMVAGGVEPDYPRPAPPKVSRLAALPSACLLVFSWAGVLSVPSVVASYLPDDRVWAWQDIASTGGNAESLGLLADVAWDEGDLDGAIIWGRAAVHLAPDDPWHRAGLAWTLAAGGNCEVARAELEAGHRLMATRSAPAEAAGDRMKGAAEAVATCGAGVR